MDNMKKAIAAFALILLFLFTNAVFAKKPADPGGGGDEYTPIPYSVCIDPGHGGDENGAVNLDLKEDVVNLEVANLLKQKLISYGYSNSLIFMTRESDIPLSNADRYNFCNNNLTALLISIHHNGS